MRNDFKLSTIAIIAAMLITMPASAATINLGGNNGGLVNNLLGGNTATPATATVNTGGGTNNGLVNGLLGTGNSTNGPTTADVNLGGSNGTQGSALLDLFGTGDNPNAAVTLGNGGDGVAGIGGVGGGPDGNVVLDLFGNGDGTGGGSDGGAGGIGGAGGNGVDLFGNGGGGIQVASIDSTVDTACFTPNAQQISKLVNRHMYSPASMSGWAGVTSIKVVEVGLCDDSKAKLAATLAGDANIARLQDFIDAHSGLRSGLARKGHSAGDVVAVDRNGNTLVVYVI